MTNELIEKFIGNGKKENRHINIHFKQRNTITGRFIRTNDYDEMKSKNFWRIVPKSKFTEWENTKDMGLSRLYNGAEFTRLSEDGE